MSKLRSAFTLLELLLVLVVIILLASFTVSIFNAVSRRVNYSRDLAAISANRAVLSLLPDEAWATNGCSTLDSHGRAWCWERRIGWSLFGAGPDGVCGTEDDVY